MTVVSHRGKMFIKLSSVACTVNIGMLVKVLCKVQRTFTIVNLPLGCAMTLSITTFSLMTLSIKTFSLMTLSITTFSLMTLSITTFSLMTLSIMSIMGLFATLSINETQQNNTHHNGIEFSYTQCSYTECHT